MVSADVEEHRVVRDVEDVVLQLFERPNACNLLTCLGVAKDKVAEAHVFFHQVAQVKTHLLRVLVYEAKTLRFGLGAVVGLCTFHN